MLRYGLAAFALKVFSLNSLTKRTYRQLGNLVGGKSRQNEDVLSVYADRARLLLDLYRKHDGIRDGDIFLELGTGWMHWFSIYLRLFYDVRIGMLDVWDNRQFDAFKGCLTHLRGQLQKEGASADVLKRLDAVLAAPSFEEIYRKFGLNYVLVPDGAMKQFGDQSLDSVFSMHVLEHVPRGLVPALVRDMYRTIKRGHITVHQIGIDDHLAHYDKNVSEKQYITYSNRTWSRFFENEIQYINRLQMSDWMREFESAGFVLVDKVVMSTTLDGLNVSSDFSEYSPSDLACTNLTVVYRKP